MERENSIESLHSELLELISDWMTPVAIRYGYSDVPLETNVKWRPIVLVLGNYSSGKSTLINEFLGAKIQSTGQAPTDDSFTVLTYDENAGDGPVEVTERRDGKHLLNDPEYPFEILKKYGQSFASHFQLKKINSPFLRNLAIIDTPGMLDSITERDRGYDYQEVVGDLAQLADLVLVLFDPHKAGTIREAHNSLRNILPKKTFEDRMLFVLNRIDECNSLIDLLRVYGTLCWNLSQITGRKDIPPIHLTYSPGAPSFSSISEENGTGYLKYLENQREELKAAILDAPKHRLDNLATFVETHSSRLQHFLEALSNFQKKRRSYQVKNIMAGLFVSVLLGAASTAGLFIWQVIPILDRSLAILTACGFSSLFFLLWIPTIYKKRLKRELKRQLAGIDEITPLNSQARRDTWELIRPTVMRYIKDTRGSFSLSEVSRDLHLMERIHKKGTREIREALAGIENRNRGEPEVPSPLPETGGHGIH